MTEPRRLGAGVAIGIGIELFDPDTDSDPDPDVCGHYFPSTISAT